jgi:hypothetical protein
MKNNSQVYISDSMLKMTHWYSLQEVQKSMTNLRTANLHAETQTKNTCWSDLLGSERCTQETSLVRLRQQKQKYTNNSEHKTKYIFPQMFSLVQY